MEAINDLTVMGVRLINTGSLMELLLRFVLDVAVIYVLARKIYYPRQRNKDNLFTLFLFNVIIFFVCFLLNSVTIGMGFAFGLFALFSLLRYRTTTVSTREMTYLLLSISIAIINAVSNQNISLVTLLFINGALIFFTWFLESVWARTEQRKSIVYEKIDLVKPENHHLLIDDLRRRTGLDVHRVEIGRLNFLRDTANVKIFFTESSIQTDPRGNGRVVHTVGEDALVEDAAVGEAS